MNKLFVLIIIAVLLGCTMEPDPESFTVRVDSVLGGAYPYTVSISGPESLPDITPGKTYQVLPGDYTVTLTVRDLEGNLVGSESKVVQHDYYTVVTFYLYYNSPVIIEMQ